MAVRLESPEPVTMAAAATPAPESPMWKPDEGMVFHTILVEQKRTAYVAIEAPADMPERDVVRALANRRDAIAESTPWWESKPTTVITELRPGIYEPDTDAKPFAISAEDLAAPPPIQIVKG